LAKAATEDALVNALVILDAFGTLVKIPNPRGNEKLRKMFATYL
jgi:hypothetical protein